MNTIKLQWRNILAGFLALFVLVGGISAFATSYEHGQEQKKMFIDQMASNQGVCPSPACHYYAKRDGYQTPREKAWYFEHITMVARARRDEQYRLAADLKKRGITMDHDALHAYDLDAE